MNMRPIFPVLALLVGGCSAAVGAVPGTRPVERPNILWLTAEDIGPNLGSYGDVDAVTPALDRLAARGTRYTRAFSVAGVCAPSRSSLITGMYASSLGSHHMRCTATLPAVVRPLPAYLRAAGYYCSNSAKEDYNFVTPADAWNESGRTAHWRKRAPGQPFFSVFNFLTTHESRLRFEDAAFAKLTAQVTAGQRHDPARVAVPGWLPDTPVVRREWARYHDLISAMDHEVAALLRELEDDGLADDTIVFFLGDHGAGVPRAKQFIFEAGLQVPLIVHVPEKWRHLMPTKPGATVTQLVSLVDLPPSVLSLVGLSVPAHMQGAAFLGPKAAAPRSHIHGIRDRMDERFDMNRTVRDGRYKYQRNYLPHLPHYPRLDYMDLLESAKEFRRLGAAHELKPGLAYFMADRKALEELYDLQSDPDELRNLAAEPGQADTLRRLREVHFDWVRRTLDTGLIPEQMLRDFAAGSSEYAYARSGAYQLERCIATVRLLERGAAAVPDLRRALQDSYGPVRFWAATGLATLGRASSPAAGDLARQLPDEHAEVAIAAAEALCYLGQPAAALPLLERLLADERPVIRLAAANVVDRIDEQARPIIAAIRRAAQDKRGEYSGANLFLMVQWVAARALLDLDRTAQTTAVAPPTPPTPPAPHAAAVPTTELTPVGVAKIEITPPQPVRLHGFPRGERLKSTSVITQPLFAKALAIGSDVDGPVLLVTADLLGVSDEMVEELHTRLRRETGFSDRTRLTVAATHTHSAPALRTVAPFIFREPPNAEQAAEIEAYGVWLMDRLVQVASEALRQRQPARLSHSTGRLEFAINRRLVVNGSWTGFGDNPKGPTDREMPMMVVRAPDGGLRAVWVSYACHGVCWRSPSVHGDWMGVAQAGIERAHAGALALVTIGCAGDQNPLDVYANDPDTPGRAMVREVARVLTEPGRPLSGTPQTKLARFDLPLQEPPGVEYWAKQTDWYSRTVLARLQRGEVLSKSFPYVVQTWTFGDDLAVVFLAGEVHAEYGLRLKRELDGKRLWVNAYANATPAYIPTPDVIPEGGWEIDGSRLNYGLPARFAPEIEAIIIREVHQLVPAGFKTTRKADR